MHNIQTPALLRTYLLALSSSTVNGFKSGRFGKSKRRRGAAEAAGAWNHGYVGTGVQSHEQGLRRGSDLGPDDVSRALYELPAGANGNKGPAGD
ncbi:hypothetical protein HanRHA438_Chr01g0005431 [Helianthus annuus]|nr:hypothetical protein HanRHA438_Chr01g0005431 [Helianthus annuus]